MKLVTIQQIKTVIKKKVFVFALNKVLKKSRAYAEWSKVHRKSGLCRLTLWLECESDWLNTDLELPLDKLTGKVAKGIIQQVQIKRRCEDLSTGVRIR